MADYESMGRFCSKLERIFELERLMTGEGQNPIVNTVMLPHYQEEHGRLVRSVSSYLAKNYPDGSLTMVLDIWNYMQEQQQEKVEEALADYDRKNACKTRQRADLLKCIGELRDILDEYKKKYSID